MVLIKDRSQPVACLQILGVSCVGPYAVGPHFSWCQSSLGLLRSHHLLLGLAWGTGWVGHTSMAKQVAHGRGKHTETGQGSRKVRHMVSAPFSASAGTSWQELCVTKEDRPSPYN